MGVLTFEGTIENGQIRLPANVRLPERAKVYIVIPDINVLPRAYIGSPRLLHLDQATDFNKAIVEESGDAGL
jgi:hypothetical protein